ncbi:class I SAM-dependent methyltransferase [Lysobacter tyrosinilyticus]
MSYLPRKGAYGIDAPMVPLLMAIGTALSFVLLLATPLRGLWLTGAVLLLSVVCYLHSTWRGKFLVWNSLLDGAELRGDERVLDLGCGRGAVLLLAAQRVPRGSAVGIDIWSTADQSGNAIAMTERNAIAEGVADRVELQTADMRELPFAADGFDLIVSNVAIHNVNDAAGREQAIDEAWRVLRPGGRLLIADISHVGTYRQRLQALGAADLHQRGLGWRMWWGGPWMRTGLVSARKPGG